MGKDSQLRKAQRGDGSGDEISADRSGRDSQLREAQRGDGKRRRKSVDRLGTDSQLREAQRGDGKKRRNIGKDRWRRALIVGRGISPGGSVKNKGRVLDGTRHRCPKKEMATTGGDPQSMPTLRLCV